MKYVLKLLAIVCLVTISYGAEVSGNSAPLPSVESVLKRVVEKSQRESGNDEAFKDRYHFKRTKATEYRNTSGVLKKRESKVRMNTPEPAPVTFASTAALAVNDTPKDPNSTKFNKEEFLMNTNLLARFQFTMVRRELVNGRPALVLDFVPLKKKLPESSIKDKFINKAAGRVWVDERDDVLVKANFRLTEKVNLVGGIVGSVSKFGFSFNRSRTAEGLWFTHLLNWHLEVREVIINRVIDFEETKTDVRKAW